MVKKPSKKLQNISLILLDRDGVLCGNRKNGIRSYSEFKLVPGLSESLKRLRAENLRIGVITNQPDISRGLLKQDLLKRMNNVIIKKAEGAGIKSSHITVKVCPHTKEDNCECRKPQIGLVNKVIAGFKLDPTRTNFYIVGDKLIDLQTLENYYRQELLPKGISRKNTVTILLEWKYGDRSKERRLMTAGNAKVVPDFNTHSLESATSLIMKLEGARLKQKS